VPELELTYNFDTPDGGYELGTGYGHIALTVNDLDATLAALAEKGIEPGASALHSPPGWLADLFRERPETAWLQTEQARREMPISFRSSRRSSKQIEGATAADGKGPSVRETYATGLEAPPLVRRPAPAASGQRRSSAAPLLEQNP
jgi:hypothetical protein